VVLPARHSGEDSRAWVSPSPQGWSAEELGDRLHLDVQDPLHDLVPQGRLRRVDLAGRFLYTTADSRRSKDQIRVRRTAHAVPLLADATALAVSPDELKAAILLFYSVLGEQQRRLFSEISKNWAGEPLYCYQKILRCIRSTRTQTALAVTAHLDRRH
jgi:hypothetical protein